MKTTPERERGQSGWVTQKQIDAIKRAEKRKRVDVTVWSHPEWSQALVLRGSPEATRKLAAEYVNPGDDVRLKSTSEKWTEAQLSRLQEFEG